MEVIHKRCCGLDIHKKLIVACLIVLGLDGVLRKDICTFGAMTDDLLKLSDWLVANGVTHVVMESTGVYWKPVYNILGGSFEVLLVNAQHIKMVPGRKSDVKDSEWIAELLRHGLLRGSFVPDRPQRELRELTGYRTSLIRERTAEVNRLQKTLEGANIKLASVASSIMGRSAREMLEALVAAPASGGWLWPAGGGSLRKKIPQLERALAGVFAPHRGFMVAHMDFLDEAIEQLDKEVRERLRPFEAAIGLLDAIPGINRRIAEALVAELGTDMTRFPSSQHLASWVGMCPGNNESAGKRMNGKTRKGSKTLRTTLVEAAPARGGPARQKATYLSAQYHRFAARRGKKKVIIAVGHSILVIVYCLLKNNATYQELGSNYFDERDRQIVERQLVRRLGAMGNRVVLEPIATAA